MDHASQPFRTRARYQPFHLTLNCQGQHILFAQRESAQNDGRERNNRASEQWPHKNAALRKKSDDALKRFRHWGDDQLANIVNDISSARPSDGSEFATSSGMGGNWISKTDRRHTLANASLELFSMTLRFAT